MKYFEGWNFTEWGKLRSLPVDEGTYNLGPARHVHFFEDVVEMGLHGFFADMQPRRNAFVGQSVNEQGDDVLFPLRKRVFHL